MLIDLSYFRYLAHRKRLTPKTLYRIEDKALFVLRNYTLVYIGAIFIRT